jgi:cysteine desulfurase
MVQPVIYLDYNATTPVAPEVMNQMLPLFLSNYGNASSSDHLLGWQAKEELENARKMLANDMGASNMDLIFTGGATESINMVLRGLSIAGKNHIVTVKTEHSAVLDTCRILEKRGMEITYLDVDHEGLVDSAELERAIRDTTWLVSVMWVNNETGIIQPVERIGELCRSRNVLFMSDATQAIGKIAIDMTNMPIDIILGSGHKIYGPKGVGFLAMKKELLQHLDPVITGGGQEYRKRAGTINLPAIVGLSYAVHLAYENLEEDTIAIRKMRDQFEANLMQQTDVTVNGNQEERLYNTSNLCFKGFDSERIMQAIGNKVAASRGSACSTGKLAPSHVLAAMGLSNEEAHASIRFSFGRYTTEEEVGSAINYINSALELISRS